ncbi:hypothetical protein HXXDennis_24 [Xanthomonas phage HXX_Dennis]|nr:hypothetical protein HXXDennis_24 [Xanthomonas phage HXX_Dennis]
MAYITATDYAERFTQRELQQLLQTAGGSLKLDAAASDATETVDSYLAAIPGRAFTLPLTVPPAKIKGVTADIARYELWAQSASEEVQRRYDQAISYLKDLVAGKARLVVDEETPVDNTGNPIYRVGYRTNGRTFTDCSLRDFVGVPGERGGRWRRG